MDILTVAETLAKFANLQPSDIQGFRSAHPDFVPPTLWTESALRIEAGNTVSTPQWRVAQEILHKTWEKGFHLDGAVRLIAIVDNMSRIKSLLQEIPTKSNDEVLELSKRGWPDPEVWPFQQAVMFLAANAWRAKFCPACGKRFVATTPKSKFCCEACFKVSRKDSQNAWWSKHGSEWRKSRKKK